LTTLKKLLINNSELHCKLFFNHEGPLAYTSHQLYNALQVVAILYILMELWSIPKYAPGGDLIKQCHQ